MDARPAKSGYCIVGFGFVLDELSVILIQNQNSFELVNEIFFDKEPISSQIKQAIKTNIGVLSDYFVDSFLFDDFKDNKNTPRTCFIALFSPSKVAQKSRQAAWLPSTKPLPVSDQDKLTIKKAKKILKKMVEDDIRILKHLLPDEFSLPKLQIVYEAVTQTKQDKRNFRKKIFAMQVLQRLDKKQKTRARSAQLYRFAN